MASQQALIAKTILKNKIKAEGLMFPDFKTYFKTNTIKTVLYLHKDKHVDQWNRIESPPINLRIHGVLDKYGKTIQWRKGRLYNKWCWEDWISTCKGKKLDSYLTSHTKTDSKWIETLNVMPKAIKLEGENMAKVSWHWIWQWFLEYDTEGTKNKNKNRQIRCHAY